MDGDPSKVRLTDTEPRTHRLCGLSLMLFDIASLFKSETQSDEQALRELTYRWSLKKLFTQVLRETVRKGILRE